MTTFLLATVTGTSFVLAQLPTPDPVSGGAGWVGAGLLGLVLGWLMLVHLPAKDKQMKELIERGDMQVRAVVGDFRAELNSERTFHEGEQQKAHDSWKAAVEKVMKGHEASTDRIVGELHILGTKITNSNAVPPPPDRTHPVKGRSNS